MNKEIIAGINKHIQEQFPYLDSDNPIIKDLPDGNLQLRYSGRPQTQNKMVLAIKVIVKVNQNGKILQITSSR